MSEENTDHQDLTLNNLWMLDEAEDNRLKWDYFNFLTPGLSDCQKKKLFCDVKLKIGEKIFECHRVILASNSPFFMALFNDECKNAAAKEEIRSLSNEYVDEKSFSKLLCAMYGESLVIGQDWIPLFTTSMFLQLTHFIDQCEQYLLENIDEIDLAEIIVLPELKISKKLYTAVKEHICRNFLKYYSRLAAISLDVLEDLLSDPELLVTNKKQLFLFGKKWIAYDTENRKQHLQLVASLLKPFHISCEQSLKIVSEIFMQDEYAVEICLKALLKSPGDHQDKEYEKLKLGVSGPMFFVKSNDDSEVLFGTFENDSWVFLNELQIPVSTSVLSTYDGAVVNDALYFIAERVQVGDETGSSRSGIIFQRLGEETQDEWIELMPPRKMASCLIPCDSTLYLYENSLDSYQFSFFEPMLNRWLKVPAVNYPRKSAGIATDNAIIYMVGGVPLKTISQETPANIVEMYDSRCGRWSRITMPPEKDNIIGKYSYKRKACFTDNTLFVVHGSTGVRIDCRNWKTLGNVNLGQSFGKHNWHLTMNKHQQELWLVNVTESQDIEIFGTDGRKKTSLMNPNVFVKPISVPWQ